MKYYELFKKDMATDQPGSRPWLNSQVSFYSWSFENPFEIT